MSSTSPFARSAAVRKTWSPQTAGVEEPGPGRAAVQRMHSSSPQWSGKPVASAEPLKAGPRQFA